VVARQKLRRWVRVHASQEVMGVRRVEVAGVEVAAAESCGEAVATAAAVCVRVCVRVCVCVCVRVWYTQNASARWECDVGFVEHKLLLLQLCGGNVMWGLCQRSVCLKSA